MPELPEVESIRSTLAPMVTGLTIRDIKIYNPNLRWTIDSSLHTAARQTKIIAIKRRAKYLIIQTDGGSLYIHFGMSGSLVKKPIGSQRDKHDHVEFVFDDFLLRYNDTRRFGSIEWQEGFNGQYHRFKKLGPEPLSAAFNPHYLKRALARRKIPIKTAIMQSGLVVGIGNIYSNESLHRAKIHPLTPAKSLTDLQRKRLVDEINHLLKKAISLGGSSLKDYVDAEGKSGKFQSLHQVYGRGDRECFTCGTPITQAETGQRATFWCPVCQPVQPAAS